MRRLTTALRCLGAGLLLATAGSVLTAPSSAANGCITPAAGSAGDPFLIITPANLVCLMNNGSYYWHHGYYFRQTADIDLTGQAQTPIGDASIAADSFTGSYDGQGHRISGLSITGAAGKSAGLFGDTDGGGTISNLRISGSVTGEDFVGGLIGWSHATTVTSVVADVAVSATVGGNGVGGLIGKTVHSTVSTSAALGSVTGGTHGIAGGLVGFVDCTAPVSTVSKSYASGNVTGLDKAGGLFGDLEATGCSFSDLYASGSTTSLGVSGFTQTGLAGSVLGINASTGSPTTNTGTRIYGRGAVSGATAGGFQGGTYSSNPEANWSASFWDTQSTGVATAKASGSLAGVSGQTTAAMTSIDTFANAGWSIVSGWTASSTTWGICPQVNAGYPFLQAFYTSDPCVDSTPPPWQQAYARAAIDTCAPGWNPSWEQWPNRGTGGFTCTRTLVYSTSTGTWVARRLTGLPA